MFAFFPYSTDAPIYHWPIATVGLIAANVVIFAGMLTGAIPNPENWILWYGDGMHPEQWISSIFTHGGFQHLFGNMLFLWVFGLVVEGKLGWWKFLACYLGIGMGQSMLEQLIMLGKNEGAPGSLGASAAIFGLMAMAMVWAPLNEIAIFWFFFFRAGTVDVSILTMAVLYSGMELLFVLVFATLSGGAVSSLLHISGFAVGLPLGIVLLRRKVVDCEGWDLFHVWRGDYGAFKKEPEPAEVFAKVEAVQQKREERISSDAQQQFRKFLEQGNATAAVRLLEKMKGAAAWPLERNELLAVVRELHNAKRWSDSAPYMSEFIRRFPEHADAMRIKLAQICVVELERPGKALDLLAEVETSKLPEQQAALAKRITAKAQQMQMEGTVEFEADTW